MLTSDDSAKSRPRKEMNVLEFRMDHKVAISRHKFILGPACFLINPSYKEDVQKPSYS